MFAPGSRVIIRDEEWMVQKTEKAPSGDEILFVIGVSPLVRDREAIFQRNLEESISQEKIIELKPEETKPVCDSSQRYLKTRLYIESMLRQTPVYGEEVGFSYQAAIDHNSYQFTPAIEALKRPRQRILIADGVGLGKTIEVGILITELMKRGKGKRILVAVIKSMLTQFQKELWARFTIPLVRLDSKGIQKIRTLIPTHANPFYYYDKVIISIDTLKQDVSYRNYLENSYWDIIVIDECHNVAVRGKNKSQRAKLASLLAKKSDTLIMASATPHDGRAETFASLMNMLDPTAIANPKDYSPDEIKGLFVRRFKKDIQEQVRDSFQTQQKTMKISCSTSLLEEEAFQALSELQFQRIDQQKRGGHFLFKTVLEKSLLSSPAACSKTIENRIRNLQKTEEAKEDLATLGQLQKRVEKISRGEFSKYQALVKWLRGEEGDLNWNGKKSDDRLIIFSERLETLYFLRDHLAQDISLDKDRVLVFHGNLDDHKQQEIVDQFGKRNSKVRLLLASDVASEGINLHFFSYKLIHFDIPWSLMTLQQRNGRIDRYGQEHTPQIYYLLNIAQNQKFKRDLRILEILLEKEQHAQNNIGDPAALLGLYDIEKEEQFVGQVIEEERSPEEFSQELEKEEDPFELFLRFDSEEENSSPTLPSSQKFSLFADNFTFYRRAFQLLNKEMGLELEEDTKNNILRFQVPEDLKHRYKYLPEEILSKDLRLSLSTDDEKVKSAYQICRTQEESWPQLELMWDLHPAMIWLHDKLMAGLRRHEAPVIFIPDKLKKEEKIFLLYSTASNHHGHVVLAHWWGISFGQARLDKVYDLEEFFAYTGLDQDNIPLRETFQIGEEIPLLMTLAVQEAQQLMQTKVKEYTLKREEKWQKKLDQIKKLKARQIAQEEPLSSLKKEARLRQIEEAFGHYQGWLEKDFSLSPQSYIQVVAIIQSET